MQNNIQNNSIQSDIHLRREKPETNILCRDYLVMKPLILWLRDIAPKYASGILVDYGCGNKPYLSFFQNKVTDYIGVDVSQNEFNTVNYVIDTDDPLPFGANSIDTLLSTQVLEHTAEPEKYIKEISRVLKPGGHLILTCPGSYMLHEEPNDFFRFTKYGIQQLANKHQLRIITLDTAGGAWRLMGQIFLNHKAFGRKFKIPIISIIFYYFWVISSNTIFSVLDTLNLNDKETVNYMIIAEKSINNE
ncbi:class I SAM-dependent methyltransferase [Patescibacteria group bacterium]|nr:class I SAM-dependent methyltransferase [Patescibacteria group bacterium]